MNTSTWRISQLRPHPKQQDVYGDLSESDFRELVDDIQRHGLRQPPEIAPDGTILDGHQRVLAYKHLGHDEIEVVVCDGLSDDELEERFIRGNLVRRQLDPLSKARAIQALADLERRRQGVPGTEFRERLAQQLGGNISGRQVDRYLQLLTLPRPIQDAVSRNELTMADALKVASLRKPQQEAIAASIKAGKSPKAVIQDHLPSQERNEAKEDDSPSDLYFVFVDFLKKELDKVSAHSRDIVGTATTHQAAAALLDRAATFCKQMRDLELAAHQQAVMEMRSKIEID